MFRERLIAFYKRHNPACLDSIDDILDIFRGREEELFHVLKEKYADVPRASQEESVLRSAVPVHAAANRQLKTLPCRSPSLAAEQIRVSQLHGETHNCREGVNLAELPSFCKDDAEGDPAQLRSDKTLTHGDSHFQHNFSCRKNSNETALLRDENNVLKRQIFSLRCEVVIFWAEKEALIRQKTDDEETLERLRGHIAHHDSIERGLIERVSASELRGKTVLEEDEFAAIIRASQRRLEDYYEEKIRFMQMEVETFYKHAAERVKEKDEIIAALKEILSHK